MDAHLKEIDAEINAAYEMCIKAGYSHEEVQRFAKPILEPVLRERRKRMLLQFLKSLAKVAGIFVIIIGTIYYVATVDSDFTERISSVFRVIHRVFFMQVLFFWDWTPLYQAPCLIANPYFGGSALLKSECEECHNLHKIKHVSKLDTDKFTHKYLMRMRPVIVEDATENWPLMNESFNIESILQWYLEDNNLEEVCKFNSSFYSNSSREALTDVLAGKASSFAIYWVNCEKNAVRYLRKFYSRPYFASEAVEFTGSSWVVLSSKFTTKDYEHEQLEDIDTVLFLVQVRGYAKLRLLPKKPCSKSCHVIEDTLNEGEIIMIPAKMWSLDYSFTQDVDNFLLGLEAYA